ncbi:MAG: superoxide dismutase [Candidatus Staskawiczbacteria bacterium RIFCSPLOWO2_01_FULL_33_9]|uniref:Superoxide dismutase n=1 Tax=Candidatus Staskawiczbacteria bacterium RIFCSPLOWO2_01_FULL_33_9 TaxID=1802211 RepID=A0A1G2I9L8_9BACT|nr:MAG: superoxide dismutase [Candidatus Staskawiczbacteria bacterium RIFCSPLOWO2_01_FULL_33_9]
MEKKYELPNLPYGYKDLEPYISEEIMMLHHDKHHAGYVNNLNIAIEKYPTLFEKSAEDLLKNLNDIPEEIRTAVKNNAGGHVNHSMFWQIMSPNGGGQPLGKLAEEIEKQFNSFSEFQQKFNDEGAKRFGSGWVWLVKNKNGMLEVMSTANQDSPISDGYFPILGNDVWEHAYYLQYKNVRADYLKAWWNVVNWQEVEKRFNG